MISWESIIRKGCYQDTTCQHLLSNSITSIAIVEMEINSGGTRDTAGDLKANKMSSES